MHFLANGPIDSSGSMRGERFLVWLCMGLLTCHSYDRMQMTSLYAPPRVTSTRVGGGQQIRTKGSSLVPSASLSRGRVPFRRS